MLRFSLVVAAATLATIVGAEQVVLQEDPDYCIAAKALVPGAKLKCVKCDSSSELQNWSTKETTMGDVTWTIGDNLCVEVTRLNRIKKFPRLRECRKTKKQRFLPNVNKSVGSQDMRPAKNSELCVSYSGPVPKAGRNIKLLRCTGGPKQRWLWLDEKAYENHIQEGGTPPVPVQSRSLYISPANDPIPGIALQTINPSIMEGYTTGSPGCDSLYDDLYNATLIHANEIIKQNVKNFFSGDGAVIKYPPIALEAEGPIRAPSAPNVADKEMAGASPASAPTDESSYETNVQEAGVDEADIVKSDGTKVFAAYGDQLVVWDVETGNELSRTKMPPKKKLSYEEGGIGDGSGGGGGGIVYPKPSVSEVNIARNEDDRRQRRHLKGTARRDSIWIPPNPKPTISGLLLHKESNRLAVIVSGYSQHYRWDYLDRPILTDEDVVVRLYDTSSVPTDGSELPLISSKTMSGGYRSARMIDDKAHLAVQSSVNVYPYVNRRLDPWQVTYDGLKKEGYIAAAKEEAKIAADLFARRLSKELNTLGGTEDCSGVSRVALFASNEETTNDFDAWPSAIISGGVLNSYIQVATFDVSSNPVEAGSLEMQTAGSFFPSSWSQVYASQDVMVLAGRGYNRRRSSRSFDEYTHLLAFKLNPDGSAPSGLATGRVPGYLLNQFSLDEKDGYLRAATTTNAKWGCLDAPEDDMQPCKWGQMTESKSQLTILKLPEGTDRSMETVSIVDNLGPTEVIYSARFINDMAYIVTFRRTDPLYTIDLSNPLRPKVTDALKITGFSTYMHPIGTTRMLAIGKEADEEGRVTGFQISLFNIENPFNTEVLQRYMIPAKWSSSQAEGDHLAFRYMADSKLLLLPVSYHGEKDGGPFDGFQVYYVDDDMIEERLSVSMVSNPQMIFRGGCWYDASLPPRSMVFKGKAMFIKR